MGILICNQLGISFFLTFEFHESIELFQGDNKTAIIEGTLCT